MLRLGGQLLLGAPMWARPGLMAGRATALSSATTTTADLSAIGLLRSGPVVLSARHSLATRWLSSQPPASKGTDLPKQPQQQQQWHDDEIHLISMRDEDPNLPPTIRQQARDASYRAIGRLGWIVVMLVFAGGIWAIFGWNSPSGLAKKARARVESNPQFKARLGHCVMRASASRSRSSYHVKQTTNKKGVKYDEISFALVDPGNVVCIVTARFKETPRNFPGGDLLPSLDIDSLELIINDEEHHILVVNGEDNITLF